MPMSKVARWALNSSAAALALATAVGAANAYETKFGEVSIVFDTTVSMGASIRTADREQGFLAEANGGNVDLRSGPGAAIVLPILANPTFNGATTANTILTNNGPNFDGSPNVDDGRLNFDNGDLIGANVKANHDLQMTWQNYKFFARAVGFYDVILDDHGAGDRSLLTDQALGDVGRNYELLDIFLSADYVVGDLPVNLRLGKQVINWGESTFILNGNNVFNPIDVNAFRRPGSEIKEALVPVNAIYGSVSLPLDLSFAGYYALDWEPFELDPSGTPFSTADVVTLGSGFGGNVDRGSIVTTSPFGGYRRNCQTQVGGTAGPGTGTRFVQTSGLLPDPTLAVNGNSRPECSESPFINYNTPYTIGQHEAVRWGLINDLSDEGVTTVTQAILGRGDDKFASDDGQYGLSLRWYAEDLGGTEFAVYFQNYHSRLPYLSIESSGRPSQVGTFIQGDNTEVATGITSRALPIAGCTPPGFNFASIQVVAGDFLSGDVAHPDPAGGPALVAGANGVPDAIDGKRVLFALTSRGTLAAGLAPGGQAAFMQSTPVSDPGGYIASATAAYTNQFGGALFNAGGSVGQRNMFAMAQLNCALAYHQTGIFDLNGPQPGGLTPQIGNGAEQLSANGDGLLFVDYPEDIHALGFSFNTTLMGWGVQGDFTYRHNAPFQVDTDSITIASIVKGCTFNILFGAAGGVVGGLATPDGSGVKPVCGQTTVTDGIIRNEMYTAQIGTTATFTASDWWVDAIGADLGVLVTEIGMVMVPGVEDTWVSKTGASVAQYQNIGCQGSDLPAGGILGLDAKTSKQCRPNDFSAGLVLLARTEYNNAFDTGFVIAPQIVYSYDFEGTTPSPYGNYLEDRQALGVSVTGTLNNNFRVGVSYSAFFGGHIANKAKDQDFASINASYSF